VGERGFTLSGGQRQRISIARTLLVNPPILILDDATSAIDVQVEQQIHAALSRLMSGRTTLIIAHRLSTISLADRVAVVEGGRVIAEGTHTDLLATEPRYVEILAQAEEEDRRAQEDQLEADAEHRFLEHEVEVDLADTRLLDEGVGLESSRNAGGGIT
ncbi:MAG TPA: ATP-binding cassette domain-containing protein, partial [Acidimicrobiia bacterium]|nr:ATP-binding cassette domain-containing protein [Acidimicrobiia bacterium]